MDFVTIEGKDPGMAVQLLFGKSVIQNPDAAQLILEMETMEAVQQDGLSLDPHEGRNAKKQQRGQHNRCAAESSQGVDELLFVA